MNNIIYIHGLGGSNKSQKYLELQKTYSENYNVYCFEWNQDDDIYSVMLEQLLKVDKTKVTFLIGSSSGGKIVYIVKEIMKKLDFTYNPFCILLNPLTNIEYTTLKDEFYNSYLCGNFDYKMLQNAFILYSNEDEVINQKVSIKEYSIFNFFYKTNDDHRLSKSFDKLKQIISEIEFYYIP